MDRLSLEPFATDYPNAANMNGLAVWPSSTRNNGIGSSLVSEVERMTQERGHPHIGLGFYVGNSAAQRFYERHGYRAITDEPVLGYDKDTSPLIVMIKEL